MKSSRFVTRDVFDLNAGVLPQMSPPPLTARWRYSTRCRAVVMSKSRPDVSKMAHGFFITINGDTGSCFNSTRGPTGFFSATHGLLVS